MSKGWAGGDSTSRYPYMGDPVIVWRDWRTLSGRPWEDLSRWLSNREFQRILSETRDSNHPPVDSGGEEARLVE